MTKTENAQTPTTYYRTAKGSHRHATWYCANTHRAIALGEPFAIAADDVAKWAPCAECCTPEAIAKHAALLAAIDAMMCRNDGVVNPQRGYSTCRDCGKEGKVNRSTGKIRAHKITGA